MRIKILVFLILVVPAVWEAGAQGSAFTYQGILKQDWVAAYGTYDFHFAVYGSETGGGPVSPSVFANGVVVSNGLFTVTLDFGASVFNSAPRWLQMGVKTNASPDPYAILAPRQPLTPAPYAIYAGNATSANLVNWSGIQAMPLAFADGIDNDTTYTAGDGLVLSGTRFFLNTNYTDARYWARSGNSGTTPGTHFVGTTDEQPLDFRVHNLRALRLETTLAGAPNLIGGSELNTIAFNSHASTIAGGYDNDIENNSIGATIGGGERNVIQAPSGSATISGGHNHRIQGSAATISGGGQNRALAARATIGGGELNVAWAEAATIAGGTRNEAINSFATVSGGATNLASGFGSAIGGGVNHIADGTYSSIGGGQSNRIDTGFLADGRGATIGGGAFNYISEWGIHGTIPGGHSNVVLFPGGFAAGSRAKANHTGSFVWADRTDADFASTADNQFAIRARAGVMIQGSDTALDLRGGGAVRVQGAGVGSSTPVFIHRATAANTSAHITTIDHPHSNGQPNAILIVTPNYNPGGAGGAYNTSAIGVYYTAGRWTIFNQVTTTPISIGAAFNVLVVKP